MIHLREGLSLPLEREIGNTDSYRLQSFPRGDDRAIRRGLSNMRIQAFLTAAAINLKRLAAALFALFWLWSLRDRAPDSRFGVA